MKENFDPSVLSEESNAILNKFYKDIADIRSLTLKLNCPTFIDNYPLFGEKLGQVKGHHDEQVNALCNCRNTRNEILSLIFALQSQCHEIEDAALGVVNSFETPYDCDIFRKGALYHAKFLNHSTHWSCRVAKKEWKKQYDKCIDLFKAVTAPLNTHNFRIGNYENGSKAYFGFTVHGVPGDFEVSFPLNSKEYSTKEHWLDGNGFPMQMHLTWRRHWTIPIFDYFFDGFGSYSISEVNAKLSEFVSTQKWKEFYNTESYHKKEIDPKTYKEYDVEVTYDDETKAYLEKILNDEIEACSREGKEIR